MTAAIQKSNLFSYALLLWLFGLPSLPAAAQVSTATTASTYTVADSIRQAAREDTTYAVQRLFHYQRRLNLSRSALWGVGLGYYGTLGVAKYYKTGSATDKVWISAAIGTVGGLLIRSSIRGYTYRSGRERKLLDAIERGQPLPTKVRKKLSPSYFGVQITVP